MCMLSKFAKRKLVWRMELQNDVKFDGSVLCSLEFQSFMIFSGIIKPASVMTNSVGLWSAVAVICNWKGLCSMCNQFSVGYLVKFLLAKTGLELHGLPQLVSAIFYVKIWRQKKVFTCFWGLFGISQRMSLCLHAIWI